MNTAAFRSSRIPLRIAVCRWPLLGALLVRGLNLFARGAVFYPDHPNAAEWLDLAKHGYASSLSAEADLSNDTVVDGKPIRQWVARRCPVFYPDFTFTHHGLGIHPGYMAIAGHRMVSLYDLLERSGNFTVL